MQGRSSDIIQGHQPMEGVIQEELCSTIENRTVKNYPSRKITWTIECFSLLNTEKIYSEIFFAGGYRWQMMIFPKGNASVNHLAIYLALVDFASLPTGSCVQINFSLGVVNQIRKDSTLRTGAQNEFSVNLSEFGFSSFIPLDILHDETKGYIVNEKIVFEAEVASCPVALVSGSYLKRKPIYSEIEASRKKKGKKKLLDSHGEDIEQPDRDSPVVVHQSTDNSSDGQGSKVASNQWAKALKEKLENGNAKVGFRDFSEIVSVSYVDVGMFPVPAGLKSFAEKLLDRNPNIADGISPTDHMDDFAFITLCSVVKGMETTSLNNTTEELILKWRKTIKRALQAGFKVDFLMEDLDSLTLSFVTKLTQSGHGDHQSKAMPVSRKKRKSTGAENGIELCSTVKQYRPRKILWTIECFSRLETNTIYSEIFFAGGYEWKIMISPNGNNHSKRLAMYLSLVDSATFSIGSSTQIKFSLGVVNQIREDDTLRKGGQHEFRFDSNELGFGAFMPLASLNDKSKGYLVDDKVIFEAEITLSQVVLDSGFHLIRPSSNFEDQNLRKKKKGNLKLLEKLQQTVRSQAEAQAIEPFDEIAIELLEKLEDENPVPKSVKVTDFYDTFLDRFVDVRNFRIPETMKSYAEKILASSEDVAAELSPVHHLNEMGLAVLCNAMKSMEITPLCAVTEPLILKWRDAIKMAMEFGFKVKFLFERLRDITIQYLWELARNPRPKKELQANDKNNNTAEKTKLLAIQKFCRRYFVKHDQLRTCVRTARKNCRRVV